MADQNPNTTQEALKDQAAANKAGETAPPNPTVKPTASGEQRGPIRTGVVSNPAPTVDPDAPPVVAKVDEGSLPQATLDEMAAGRRAIERNRPVASAMEAGRAAQASENTTLQRK